MTRQEVEKETEQMFGLLSSMLKAVPDSSLERQLLKRVQFDKGSLPDKNRECSGVAISAISKCRRCAYYHTQLAKLNGATEAEADVAAILEDITDESVLIIECHHVQVSQLCFSQLRYLMRAHDFLWTPNKKGGEYNY